MVWFTMSVHRPHTSPAAWRPDLDGAVVGAAHHLVIAHAEAANRTSVVGQRTHTYPRICRPHLTDTVYTVYTTIHTIAASSLITLMLESQDPEMSQSPKETTQLTASLWPFKSVDLVNEQDCLRFLARAVATPIARPQARSAWCSKACGISRFQSKVRLQMQIQMDRDTCNTSIKRLDLSAPFIRGWPLITSLKKQLSINGKRTRLSSGRQWGSLSCGRCSIHLKQIYVKAEEV